MDIRCAICTMGFHVEERASNTERLRCPDCKRPFTSGVAERNGGHDPVRVSIQPDQLAEWRPEL